MVRAEDRCTKEVSGPWALIGKALSALYWAMVPFCGRKVVEIVNIYSLALYMGCAVAGAARCGTSLIPGAKYSNSSY